MASSFVLAVVSDLFFVVKIGDAAKRAGVAIRFVSNGGRALETARGGVALVIVDLNNDVADPLKLISELKSGEDTRTVSILAYVSHVQVELKRKAEEAGCDRVMARSSLSENLNQIFASVAASVNATAAASLSAAAPESIE